MAASDLPADLLPVRSNPWTVVAIAIVAYAACDMTHEVLGHGIATGLVPNVRALGLSTIGLQTSGSSRFVAAAGSIANVLAGLVSMALARRGRGFGPGRWFAWLFGILNLLNATGYPLFSGVLDFGDWAVVIASLEPHGAWRVVLALAGAGLYGWVVRVGAAELLLWIRGGELHPAEVPRLVIPAYVSGGLLLVVGSALNPVGPHLILLSGASTGFACMAGLLLVPRLTQSAGSGAGTPATPLRFAPTWVGAAVVVAAVFIGVLGRGVRLG